MFYSGKDIKSVTHQMWIFSAIDFAVLVGGFVLAFLVALNKSAGWGSAIATATICVVIFILGNFIMPCVHYYKYLMEVFTGKYVKRSGIISQISPNPIYKDNKNYYYEVDMDLGDSKCGLFLFDANLGKPKFNVGDEKILICYENYIVKIEELG